LIDPRLQITSRRKLLSLGCNGGMMSLLGIAQTSEIQSSPALIPEVKSVVSFGARGDGSTDDTSAFQRALDSVHKAGGGTVYLFRGTLDVPEGVSLRGSYLCVPSHTGIRDKGQTKPGEDGTALLVTSGRGKGWETVPNAEQRQLGEWSLVSFTRSRMQRAYPRRIRGRLRCVEKIRPCRMLSCSIPI
jgi:hypothetical protein